MRAIHKQICLSTFIIGLFTTTGGLASCSMVNDTHYSAYTILIEEGKNISGIYELGDTTTIKYSYTFAPKTKQAPDSLEMSFSFVQSPPIDDFLLLQVFAKPSRLLLYEHLLFEINGGVNQTGDQRKFIITSYNAHSFGIVRQFD